MKKGREILRLSPAYMLVGAFTGGILFKGWVKGAIIGAGCTILLAFFVMECLIRLKKEKFCQALNYGMAGLLPGVLLAAHVFPHSGLLIPVSGAILGDILFGWGVAAYVNGEKEKKRYMAFSWEISTITFLGFLGAWSGNWVIDWVMSKVFSPASYVVLQKGIGFLFSFAVSLLLALLPGYIFAGNRFRPVLGGVLVFVGGLLVMWIGIDIAPFLFLPGSGLMWSGMVIGSLMLTLALLVVIYPAMQMLLGSLVIIVSVLSFIGAAGGFIIGGITGILGGMLVIAWNGPVHDYHLHAGEEIPF
ncbi:DUF6114 domain-containing protein [Aneurinibacillus terranovensis]|uniref:DUF6114 domain-containing protein n=1 Tax=Aneurinibacillus terranovensis TaxID=278991 RepID=UPI000687D706|nr:DUF6114 domain-containing protein [Aneurinibacillus terranovensis]